MSTRGIELKLYKVLVGWRGDVLPFLVEGATAPRQEQVVGGVGRWGRMTGTQGRLIAFMPFKLGVHLVKGVDAEVDRAGDELSRLRDMLENEQDWLSVKSLLTP
ncbi:MAG: hypothetical protein NTZ04_02170 [Chloroflexi bacterium]|nr:hypothetical protein [Chloroflexota bacterium]